MLPCAASFLFAAYFYVRLIRLDLSAVHRKLISVPFEFSTGVLTIEKRQDKKGPGARAAQVSFVCDGHHEK
jgi:hypothetical protein